MTQANANMNAFFLACRNRIVVGKGPLNPHLNRTSGPSDAPTDVVPPPGKDPKGKHKHNKRSHCDHQSGSGKLLVIRKGAPERKKSSNKCLSFNLPLPRPWPTSRPWPTKVYLLRTFNWIVSSLRRWSLTMGGKCWARAMILLIGPSSGPFLLRLRLWPNICRGPRMSMPWRISYWRLKNLWTRYFRLTLSWQGTTRT